MTIYPITKFLDIAISDRVVEWRHPHKVEQYCRSEDWIKNYENCRLCGKPLPEERFAFALSNFTKGLCSVDCFYQEEKNRFACCDNAKRIHCVCAAAYSCPDHGETHVGTHD
jgi:hypothetical protein